MQMQTDNKKNSNFTIAILAILTCPHVNEEEKCRDRETISNASDDDK